jgi:TonB family protein
MRRTHQLLLFAAAALFAFALLHASAASLSAAQAQDDKQKPAAQMQAAAAADDKFARGAKLLEQGDAAAAAPLLRDAAERRKTDAEAWYYYGLARGRTRQEKDARKAFERAAKLRPSWADPHAGIALAMLTAGKPRDAEVAARRALEVDPRQGEAHYVLGYLRFEEEKFPEALSEAELALSARPDFAPAAYLAADALLNVYTDESIRVAAKYPYPRDPTAAEGERKVIMARREPALLPFKTRMRELAERLEALAAARPASPDAAGWRGQAESLRLYARPVAEGGFVGVMPTDQLTTKAVITYKPEPGFTEKARQNGVTGAVRLRVVLGADGRVRHIDPVRSLPDGLTEMAVEAARKVRFKPATFEGRPVSQFVVLEYNFNIY